MDQLTRKMKVYLADYMKLYTINALAKGYYTVPDVDCPSKWRGSGVYDVDVECTQEAKFHVAATTLAKALKLVDDKFGECQGYNWSYTVEEVYYDPDIDVSEIEGNEEEILDVEYDEPEDGDYVPKDYKLI